MNKLIFCIIFCIILVSFIANPAPVSIEIEDLILMALPCLICVLCLAITTYYIVYSVEYDLFIAMILYGGYLLLSILMGFLHGVPFLNVLRASGPYINFFPLLAIGLLPARILNPWWIASILIMIGTLQAGYQLYLYLDQANHMVDTWDVLRGRITLIDPRATLPIVLSAAILPFAFFSSKQTYSKQSIFINVVCAFFILFGFFGGMVTLTRSIVLSIFFGWFLFIFLFIYYQSKQDKVLLKKSFNKILFYGLLVIITFIFISIIPKIYLLEQGLLARFYHSSSFSTSGDYSNGRIHDEWIPALTVWMNSDIISIFFGIGAGNTFMVATGEERSYVHNLLIYSLVYGGFFGLFTCVWLYVTAFKTLIIRAFETQQIVYLSLAALLGSIFFYGQLFAVHKGLAFNAMLFLILALALHRRAARIN